MLLLNNTCDVRARYQLPDRHIPGIKQLKDEKRWAFGLHGNTPILQTFDEKNRSHSWSVLLRTKSFGKTDHTSGDRDKETGSFVFSVPPAGTKRTTYWYRCVTRNLEISNSVRKSASSTIKSSKKNLDIHLEVSFIDHQVFKKRNIYIYNTHMNPSCMQNLPHVAILMSLNGMSYHTYDIQYYTDLVPGTT